MYSNPDWWCQIRPTSWRMSARIVSARGLKLCSSVFWHEMRKSRLLLCTSLGSVLTETQDLISQTEAIWNFTNKKMNSFVDYLQQEAGPPPEFTLTFRASERFASSLSMFPAAVATSALALLDSTVKWGLCLWYIWNSQRTEGEEVQRRCCRVWSHVQMRGLFASHH